MRHSLLLIFCITILLQFVTCRGSDFTENQAPRYPAEFSNQNGHSPLMATVLQPLPLGSIRPAGWLTDQLRIQADGLSGHLDEFWPDIQDSSWFGGGSDAWERAPYWLDGTVPLAFLLEDAELMGRIKNYMDKILKQQKASGWIAPGDENGQYDLWAIFLVLKPLIQYYEATADHRVPTAVENCLRWVDNHIGPRPLFNWGKFRWFEALLPIYWLYERKADPWLLDLAVKLHAQGFDWIDFFRRWPLTQPTPKGKWNYMGHVVNNAMAVKAPALWWRLSGEKNDLAMVKQMMSLQDEFHGQVTGIFTGDECLAGKNPSQGTELCAVMEYLYSLEVLLSITGDPALGDRLEKIAFNALPATFSPDMWSHQYDQQVNQVECSITENRLWNTNGPDSNIFGLEPNYGCCTANLSQGWPKFASHLWMRKGESGLAAVAYAPCVVKTNIRGSDIEVRVETGYPFRETVQIQVHTEQPLRFSLDLRIPNWAENATLQLEGEKEKTVPPGTFYLLDKVWSGTETLLLRFPMTPRASRRYHQALSLERGPLIYSLKLGENWTRVNTDAPHRNLPHADWEVYPTTPWNFALDLNEQTVAQDIVFIEHPIGPIPFSPKDAPVTARLKGILLDSWRLVNGSAGEIPQSPVSLSGPKVELVLIPYGCTNLRVTEFPTLR